MEAKVLVDRQGRIVSAVLGRRPPTDIETGPPAPNMGLVAEDGLEIVELGLPDEFERQPFSAVVERLTAALKGRAK